MKKFIALAFVVIGCFMSAQDSASAAVVPSEPKQVAQVIYGGYCCDAYGNRRCVLVNIAPLGSACFCSGQGWGATCL